MQEIFEKYYKIIQSNELFEGIDEKNLPAVLENLKAVIKQYVKGEYISCLLYTSPSPRD